MKEDKEIRERIEGLYKVLYENKFKSDTISLLVSEKTRAKIEALKWVLNE